jgi:hypothetical protein
MAGLVIYRGTEGASVALPGEGTLSVIPGQQYSVSLANAALLIGSNPRMWEAGNAETATYNPPNTMVLTRLTATDYGITPGVDCTTAISAFFDTCHALNRNAYFPKGVYKCGKIVKTYGLNILADPGAEIEAISTTTGELWTFEGSLGTPKNLEAEALAGARIIKIASTTGRVKGEILKLGTVTQVANNGGAGGGTRFCGQLVEISAVLNATDIETRERLYRTFTTFAGADKTTVTPINVIKGMSVEGLKFINPTEANARFLTIQLARDVDIEIETDLPLQPGLELQDVYGFRVTSRSEHGQHDNSTKFGYAVSVSAGSCHGQVNTVCANGNFAFSNTGVNNVPGEPYDISVTGICDNSTKSGIFLHPEGHDFLVDAMQILNPTEHGIEAGCPRTTIQGCSIVGAKEDGVRVVTNGVSRIRIIGNVITEPERHGVNLNNSTTMEDIAVSENTFDSVGKTGINSTGPLIRYRQRGNTYTRIGTSGSEGYCWRHQKAVTSGAIVDEVVDATSANQKVSRFEVAATATVVARCIVKKANSAAKWGFDSGGEEPKNGVESGGVLYEANLISTT